MKKLKQILAIIGIILILSMYVAAFVSAFMKSETAAAIFRGAIGCTILVPVFLYLVMMVARLVTPKKSEAVDNVILDRHGILEDEDGGDLWYARELSGGLRSHGYRVFVAESSDESALKDILSENHLKADRTLCLVSDPDASALAKSLGCSAYIFKDYTDAQADLAKIGVIWTK